MNSTTMNHLDHYAKLFANPEVRKFYGNGQPIEREKIEKILNNMWAKRWTEGNPFGGFAVFLKDTTDNFVRHCVLGKNQTAGTASMGIITHQTFWGKGLGYEMLTALFHWGLIIKTYEPKQGNYFLEMPISRITAEVNPENIAGSKLLQKMGMIQSTEQTTGADR